ncbi:hypothetical protein [Zunongwangia sp. H14]|uniref:hypothetical protein n=1 Tax=Zunongwangia sp. H14 TaxID=3240792 RepID=UPI00356599FB
MMKKLVVLFILMSCGAFAQNPIQDYVGIRDQLKLLNTDSGYNSKLAGSPYLEESFQPGQIVLDKDKTQRAYFRYNAVKDIVEIKADKNQDKVFTLPRNSEYAFRLNNYTYVVGNVKTREGDFLRGYLMQYFKGENVTLIAKPSAEVIPAKTAETSYGKSEPATLKVDVNYFIKVDGDNFQEVKLKERHFRKILSTNQIMEDYFAEHKVRTIEDVIAMLQFYEVHA